MNKETMPGIENQVETTESPEIEGDILDIQNEFIDNNLDSLPEGTEGVYEKADQEKRFGIFKAQEELRRLDEKEELKQKKGRVYQ